MARNVETPAEEDLKALLGGVVGEAEKLIGQQFALLKDEVRQELRKAAGAALSFGAGAGLLTAGGVLSTLALVHGLHQATRLPLWACYALAAGAAGAAGAGLLAAARRQAAGLQLPELPQTTAALKENLTWLKEQVTSPSA